jgi:hypothetical protein
VREGERLFSREEAEALLVEVAPALERARQLAQELAEADRVAQEQRWRARGDGHVVETRPEPSERRWREAANELAEIVHRLQRLGIVVRDVRTGLIDFPSLREGRTVYLCWQVGEPPRIAWWHTPEAGFPGRQPL